MHITGRSVSDPRTDACWLTKSFKEHSAPFVFVRDRPVHRKALLFVCQSYSWPRDVLAGAGQLWQLLHHRVDCIKKKKKNQLIQGRPVEGSRFPLKVWHIKLRKSLPASSWNLCACLAKAILILDASLWRWRKRAPCWAPPPLQLYLSLANDDSCNRALIYARQV